MYKDGVLSTSAEIKRVYFISVSATSDVEKQLIQGFNAFRKFITFFGFCVCVKYDMKVIFAYLISNLKRCFICFALTKMLCSLIKTIVVLLRVVARV